MLLISLESVSGVSFFGVYKPHDVVPSVKLGLVARSSFSRSLISGVAYLVSLEVSIVGIRNSEIHLNK